MKSPLPSYVCNRFKQTKRSVIIIAKSFQFLIKVNTYWNTSSIRITDVECLLLKQMAKRKQSKIEIIVTLNNVTSHSFFIWHTLERQLTPKMHDNHLKTSQ